MRKLRPREVNSFTENHTALNGRAGREPRYPDSEAMQLTTNHAASSEVKHGNGEGWSWTQSPAVLPSGLGFSLCFLICKVGLVTAASQGCSEDGVR